MRRVWLLVGLVTLDLVAAGEEKRNDRVPMDNDVWRGRRFILNDINLGTALGIVDGAVDVIENNDELGAWLGVPEETPGETPDEVPDEKPQEAVDVDLLPFLPVPAMATLPRPASCFQVTLDIATKPYDQVHWEDPGSGALANIKDLLGSLSGDGQVELVSTAKVHNFFFKGCTLFASGRYMRESTLKVTSSSAEHTMELINALEAAEEVAHSIRAVDRSLCGVDVLRYTSMRTEDPWECQQVSG